MTSITQPPAPRLSAQWQDWLAGNIVRGCLDDDLLAAMRGNGFDEQYARVAISVVRSMTERVQQSAPTALIDYKADPPKIPNRTRIRSADRDVELGFMLVNPNVGLLSGLLSDQECDKLIQLSQGKLRRSEVVDRSTGTTEVSAVRTSEGTYFDRGENAVVERIERRIAELTGLPVENGEPLQILRYGVGAQYQAHHDYFDPKDPGTAALLAQGGQRVATVVMYLNDVDEGGDTVFPDLELSVKPRRGHAVYFEYMNQAGELDARCLHGGAPVTRGEKWIATKWLRQGPYRKAG